MFSFFSSISRKVHFLQLSNFNSGSDGKECACNAGDLGLIPALGGSPGVGHGNPLQYSCLENPRGQRSLAGYSPWGCKESDPTEQISTQHVQNRFIIPPKLEPAIKPCYQKVGVVPYSCALYRALSLRSPWTFCFLLMFYMVFIKKHNIWYDLGNTLTHSV